MLEHGRAAQPAMPFKSGILAWVASLDCGSRGNGDNGEERTEQGIRWGDIRTREDMEDYYQDEEQPGAEIEEREVVTAEGEDNENRPI